MEIPAQFDEVQWFEDGLAAVCMSGKWGYIDKSGRFRIPARYDLAWRFFEGMAGVKLDGKWGYVDTHGKSIFP
jgi:hypothetical protein